MHLHTLCIVKNSENRHVLIPTQSGHNEMDLTINLRL